MSFTPHELDQLEQHAIRADRDAQFHKAHPEYSEPNAHVHPLFASILNSAARPFRARVGKRPAFATSHEAVQYERGFSEYPNQPPGLPHGPRMQGYLDAEHAHADALASQRRERTSDFAELS